MTFAGRRSPDRRPIVTHLTCGRLARSAGPCGPSAACAKAIIAPARVGPQPARRARARFQSAQISSGDRLFSIIQAAGWPIWPLILCSIAALTVVIERFTSLRTVRVAPPKLLDEVLSVTRQGLPSVDVVAKLAANSVLGEVLASGLRAVVLEPRMAEAALRNVFESAGRVAVHRLERYLNTLGTVAAAAPLLGLLGTVVGMIELFGAQSPSSGANPEQIAHGISVALYNTAFGLIIAIPSLMFYRYFRGRVDEYVLEMEQASERLVPQLLRITSRIAA